MKVPVRRTFSTPNAPALQPKEAVRVPGAFGETVGDSLNRLGGNIAALSTFMQQQEEQRNRFAALQSLAELERDSKLSLADRLRNATPGDTSIYSAQNEDFIKRQKAFLASLPEDLRDEFSVRSTELGAGLSLQAMEGQYANNDAYYKQGVQDLTEMAKVEIGQDPSRETLEIWRKRLDEALSSTGLGNEEKVAIQRKVYTALEGVAYRGAQVRRLTDEANGIGTETDQAVELLQQVGGMSEEDAVKVVRQSAMTVEAAVGDDYASLPQRTRAALLIAQATSGITPEILEAVHSGDQDKIAEALRKNGNESLGDLIQNSGAFLDNDPAYANVPYEDRITLTEDAQRQVAASILDEQQAKKSENQSMVNALKVALFDGTAGQTDIDQLREAGVLTNYDDIKSAQDILAKRDADLMLQQRGQQMLAGQVTFAPGNEDDKKVLNALVGQEGLNSIDNMDSEYAANTFIPIVRKTGGLPSEAQQLISGMIRNQNPDKAYWALDLMQQIERANPRAFDSFPVDDQKALFQWQARKDYLTQEDMLKVIRGPLDPAEANARAALRTQGEKLFTAENGVMKGFDPTTLFKSGFLGLGHADHPSTPWVDQQLSTDFQTLFLDAYEANGDVEASKQIAFKQMERVWGISNTGADNKLMKYPPEKAYPPVAESYDWMERQLREAGVVQPDEQFELVSDTQTENEWGVSPPSYLVSTKKDGVQRILFDASGKPLRFAFDYGAQEKADEADWKVQQQLILDQQNAERIVSQGLQKHLEDGTTIPDELFNEYATSGLLQRMMAADPQAVQNGQAWQDAVDGTGPQAGFETNAYRLK